MKLHSSLLSSLALLLWCSTAMACFGGGSSSSNGGCTSYGARDCYRNGCQMSDSSSTPCGCLPEDSDCSYYTPAGSSEHDELRRRRSPMAEDEVSNNLRIKRAAGITVTRAVGTSICTGYEVKERGGSGPRGFKVVCHQVPDFNQLQRCSCSKTITCYFKGNPHGSGRYNQDNDHKRVFYEKLLDAVSADIVANKRCPEIGETYDIKKFELKPHAQFKSVSDL